MTIETATLTDVGRDPAHNEDAVRTDEVGDWTVLAVADGMGGHRAGDIASETAIEAFFEFLEREVPGDGPRDDRDPEEAVVAAVEASNDRLRERIEDDPELEGMGTTLVGAVVDGGTVTLVNVGDSRTYHVDADCIEQVTTDQSLVQQLVDQGSIDPEEADEHPQKHVLSQALGTHDEVEPDVYQLALDGTLLLCSDGLSDEVPETAIFEVITDADSLEAAAEDLVNRANEIDGSDNVSVALCREVSDSGDDESAGQGRLSRLRGLLGR